MKRHPRFSLRRLFYWFTACIFVAYLLGDLGTPAWVLATEKPWLVVALIGIAILLETLVSGAIRGFDSLLRIGLEEEKRPNHDKEE